MTTVVFSDRAAFVAWHRQVCADNDIPAFGYRQSDNAPMPNNAWTTAYVQPYTCEGVAGVLADVSDDDVTRYGLTAIAKDAARILADAQPVTMGAPSKVARLTEDHRSKPSRINVANVSLRLVGDRYEKESP